VTVPLSEAQPSPHRTVCERCRRPASVCYCAELRPLPTRTRVVFLQHPRERRTPIGTARMAHLALPNSELHVGVQFDPALVRGSEGTTALLYPGPDAMDVRELQGRPLDRLVVVDGTWSQAKKVVKVNPFLRALPHVRLNPSAPGNYRIRREPAPHCLSTIEAVSEVLGVLEDAPEPFRDMLRAFTYMVDRQLDYVNGQRSLSRYLVHRGPPKLTHRWPGLVAAAGERAVLVCIEVNQRTVEGADALAPELLHLAAERPATGERFEALIRPERPLGESTPFHLELEAAALEAGEARSEALRRFGAFLEEGATLLHWGHFTADVLRASGVQSPQMVDVRPPMIRACRSRLAGVEAALECVAPSCRPSPWAQGRAGQRLAVLAEVVKAGRGAR